MLDIVTTGPQAAGLVPSLAGKKGLVVGIANDKSIAWGCARAYRALGADLAVTYLNDKAERFVRPLAEELGAEIFVKADVTHPGELEAVFETIGARWGRLDFLLHAIAFAPADDLHGRVVDCSRDGFLQAMDISCHSLIRMVKLAEPLMNEGGAVQTLSYLGSEKVVDNYNVMGPVKAALESVTRYLASELGPKRIRVNTLSPGPLMTRAASGIGHFDDLVAKVVERAPTRQLATIEEVGALSAFLMTDLAASVNGELIHVDGGYNVMA
jgi:enoyl-[acyl-carrier protein] reductase I